jgi:1,4-dihydroxy-2-naphthoyl-CoA hydrolase
MPPPYDLHNFLDLLGIVLHEDDDTQITGQFTATHPLIAGNGFLWAPVVIALCDALCAIGVGRNWPVGASGFTTAENKTNFLSTAREGEVVFGTATSLHIGRTTQVWDATAVNQSSGRLMASYRCTQLMLYPRD